MKRSSIAVFVFISFFLAASPRGAFAEELANKETIREDLDGYYKSYGEKMRLKREMGEWQKVELDHPNCWGHFDRLFGVDDALRSESCEYLLALLDRCLADELAPDARHAIPVAVDDPRDNAASSIRGHVSGRIWDGIKSRLERDEEGKYLGKYYISAEIAKILDWLLFEEISTSRHSSVIRLIRWAVGGEHGEQLLLKILSEPSENYRVILEAIEEIKEREIKPEKEILAKLCSDYRLSVRSAAAELYESFGYKDPPDVDFKAFGESEKAAGIMARIVAMVTDIETIRETDFIKVNVTQPRWREDVHFSTPGGWLIYEDDESFVILTAQGEYARYIRLADTPWKGLKYSFKAVDEKVVAEAALSWLDIPIAWRRMDMPEAREAYYENRSLRNSFTGNIIMRRSASYGIVGILETYLLIEMWEAGESELFGKLLAAMLDQYKTDREFVDRMKSMFGTLYGERMIEAFGLDRDYEKALEWAALILDEYPHSQYAKEAAVLSEELPPRTDDFKGLRLPTSEEWEVLKEKLTRREQVEYLCDRMCLLQGWGALGNEPRQYREMDSNSRLRPVDAPKTEVVNPPRELSPNGGMFTTLKDIPAMAPYLRRDGLCLRINTGWRTYPLRLVRFNRILMQMINYAAGKELLDTGDFIRLDEAEIDNLVEEITAWAEKESARPDDELLSIVQNGEKWKDVRAYARLLASKQDLRAVPAMLHYLESEAGTNSLREILSICRKLDSATAAGAVREMIDSNEQYYHLAIAVGLLFDESSKESVEAAAKALNQLGGERAPSSVRGKVVDLFLEHAPEYVYRFYANTLREATAGESAGKVVPLPHRKKTFFFEVLERCLPDAPELEAAKPPFDRYAYTRKDGEDIPAENVRFLIEWLVKQLKDSEE